MTYDLTYQKAVGCTGGPEPGTLALRDHILERWAGTANLGVYNCRKIRGLSVSWSIHAEGRAMDIGVDPKDSATVAVGDSIADWLIEYAPELGVQFLIWNRRKWRPDYGWKRYFGVHPHRDHLHVEQVREAAAALTAADIRGCEGPETRPGTVFDPPLEPIRSVLQVGDGYVMMSEDGDIYCFGTTYHGGPNHEIYGREFEMLGVPDRLVPHPDPDGYTVATDRNYGYGYPR